MRQLFQQSLVVSEIVFILHLRKHDLRITKQIFRDHREETFALDCVTAPAQRKRGFVNILV